MKYLIINIASLLLISSSTFTMSHRHSCIPENNLNIPVSYEKSSITALEFNNFLDILAETFGPEIEKRGGVLEIKRDWGDGSVNAFAWREGRYYVLEILGGLARHSLVTKDAFALMVCHELGHLLGGLPGSYAISYEGQADYFGPMKCMRNLYEKLNWNSEVLDIPISLKNKCGNVEDCLRNLSAGKSLSNLYAEVLKEDPTYFLKPDTHVVSKTYTKHPSAQCRLDTYVASTLCPTSKDIHFSNEEQKTGACHLDMFPLFKRPACWYRYE